MLGEGQSVAAVARDLDLTETALRDWVKRAAADRTKGRTGLTTAEREELARLRKENRILQEERELVKSGRPSSPSTSDEIRVHRRGEGPAFSDPIAANLLDRESTAAAPNQRWVGDTTEFAIGDGATLYLAAVLDLYSRFVVGWAVSAVNDRRLTLKALAMAVHRRCPAPGLLHHSDRGCTYTCADYQRYLAGRGITCSMSRRADCYDNAVMESFFATMKKEEAERFRATATRRWRCSTTSRRSTTSGAGIPRSARSVRPHLNAVHRQRGGTVGRPVASTSRRLTTTGTPPSACRRSSNHAEQQHMRTERAS